MGKQNLMISNFTMVGYVSRPQLKPFGVSLSTSETREEALAIARDCIENETACVLGVFFTYTEAGLDFTLKTNDQGDEEEIEIKGSVAVPEIVLAELPGRMLSELMQGSSIADEVIGDRVILECRYNSEISCLTVVVEGASKGWWFMR